MKGILQITTMVIRNLEKIPVKDFILSSCKLKTSLCIKMAISANTFEVFDCKCSAATKESSFPAGHLFLQNPSPWLLLKY